MIRIGVTSRCWPGRGDALGSQREAALVMPAALAQMLGDAGAIALLLPRLRAEQIAACAQTLDGLLVQGGDDVAPALYGEAPLQPQWQGDAERDKVEISLLQHFVDLGKPVLGVCRGCQLINVAFGGSLYQDLPRQLENARVHSDPARYIGLDHQIELDPAGYLQALYARHRGRVNSAHHQGVRVLGAGLETLAASADDGLIEALRLRGDAYVVGVQWHPEFASPFQTDALPGGVLIDDFVEQARRARDG